MDCKIRPVSPKGNQPWIFFGRAEAEAPVFWPPDTRRRCIGKDPVAGKDCRQKEREKQRVRWLDSTIDSKDMNLSKFQEMVKGQGSLACCSPWDCRGEHDLVNESESESCSVVFNSLRKP